VVRRTIATTGQDPATLAWRDLDLTADPVWAEAGQTDTVVQAVQEGDLLQAGERIVVLYEDRGVPGVLEGEDFVIDLYRGASVRRLDEVFEGSGVLSWASLRLDAKE
jgi:hypothetical protein